MYQKFSSIPNFDGFNFCNLFYLWKLNMHEKKWLYGIRNQRLVATTQGRIFASAHTTDV